MQKSKTKIFLYFFLLLSIFTLEGIDFLHNHTDISETNCPACILSTNLSATIDTIKDNFVSYISSQTINFPEDSKFSFIIFFSVLTDRAPPSAS